MTTVTDATILGNGIETAAEYARAESATVGGGSAETATAESRTSVGPHERADVSSNASERPPSVIRAFAHAHPLEGYRRLAFMMLDADPQSSDHVACSPSSVYRVLKSAGLLAGSSPVPTKKGTGFVQPLQAHEHWHVDISYLNIASTFYFLCSVLDGMSRFIVHWEIREKMEEKDVETILQRARECHPGVTPRIISDNGPQFLSRDFKEFIRIAGMTHVKTSPYYPCHLALQTRPLSCASKPARTWIGHFFV